ncbi:molybdopterin-dependent oxidoreductase [Bradyrhizobium sp. CCGB12]|uniref:molybdopterin-dependent oxidoreductase n=1 Tax=Bradyrhizobium sp. CCGB12 TaxID=2949632 RepID=UPI0020B4326A|nr:molybdopterin-dependent oxidoreductase [Bradyrhizobium sp. CCGB12]MCP3392249.1 molybdopterin-dependent oxidoreductase [Bradyrhizobium sp. CCGB12]
MPHIVGHMDKLKAPQPAGTCLSRIAKLYLAFAGSPLNPGLVGKHMVKMGLEKMRAAGTRLINISPENTSLETGGEVEWIPIRPNTDTAMLLAIAQTLYTEGLHDEVFMAKYCVGFDRFLLYLLGVSDGVAKTPEWAESITAVSAERIRRLARGLTRARVRSSPWALQRAHHGEQPPWA